MNRSRELAELLLGKAADDEYVFEKLSEDPKAPNHIVLFHAQQAVEKMKCLRLARAWAESMLRQHRAGGDP